MGLEFMASVQLMVLPFRQRTQAAAERSEAGTCPGRLVCSSPSISVRKTPGSISHFWMNPEVCAAFHGHAFCCWWKHMAEVPSHAGVPFRPWGTAIRCQLVDLFPLTLATRV